MTASEFAQYIFNKFPQAVSRVSFGTVFSVLKAGCYQKVYVLEPTSGKTKVFIEGVRYTEMSAEEKREAKQFIDNLQFDIVTRTDVCSNHTMVGNFERGLYTEGQVINIVGGDKPWLTIDKVEHIG